MTAKPLADCLALLENKAYTLECCDSENTNTEAREYRRWIAKLESLAPEARDTDPVEWHLREKEAFDAWWKSRGDYKHDEPAHLAAGAAWFARAQLPQTKA